MKSPYKPRSKDKTTWHDFRVEEEKISAKNATVGDLVKLWEKLDEDIKKNNRHN